MSNSYYISTLTTLGYPYNVVMDNGNTYTIGNRSYTYYNDPEAFKLINDPKQQFIKQQINELEQSLQRQTLEELQPQMDKTKYIDAMLEKLTTDYKNEFTRVKKELEQKTLEELKTVKLTVDIEDLVEVTHEKDYNGPANNVAS